MTVAHLRTTRKGTTMFATLRRSWEFAKISYGIIWDHKSLIVFPLVSIVAASLVTLSFLFPLWTSGTLETWMAFVDPDSTTQATTGEQAIMYLVLFLFYFCTYFVIVFFNSGLTACALKVVSGEVPTLGYGFSMAAKRLPQILAWAFLSAVIGVILKMIENVNERAGRWVAALLGSAWTALTYFVVPVLVMDGVWPIMAIKLSLGTLKGTWGEALVGRFSMGFLSFLIMLPFLLIAGVIISVAFVSSNMVSMALGIALAVGIIVIVSAFTSAADVVFKALLYNYATGRSVPENVDTSSFDAAFAPKD